MPTKRVVERTVSKALKNETIFGTIMKRSFGRIVTKEISKCHAWSKIIDQRCDSVRNNASHVAELHASNCKLFIRQAVESVAAEGGWRILRQITIPISEFMSVLHCLERLKRKGNYHELFVCNSVIHRSNNFGYILCK